MPSRAWESLGVRRPEGLCQTGLEWPDGRPPLNLLLRKLPEELFTLESCLERGEVGMLSVYFLKGSSPGLNRPVCSVAEWVMRSEAGSLDLNSLEDREVVPALL